MECVKDGKISQIFRFSMGVRRANIRIRGVGMTDVIFVALTITLFVIFGFVVKAVERL